MAKQKKVRTKLTRADMEDIIKGGGSVLHDGELITDLKSLPDEVDLAETDAELAEAEEKIAGEEEAVATKKTKAASKRSTRKK